MTVNSLYLIAFEQNDLGLQMSTLQ